MVDGFFLIDKQTGPTSHDVVNTVRRVIGQKRVGHTGTLDPMATGLLIMLLGKATRLAQWMQLADKTYTGTIRLGISTDTLDAQGKVVLEERCHPELEQIKAAANSLTGELSQRPPAFSAIKIKGTPAYRIAARGEKVNITPRNVTVSKYDVWLEEAGEDPLIGFSISCSSGTYVRVLAVDLGTYLKCPAHLASLRRTSVGKFSVDDSVTLEDISKLDDEGRNKEIRPMRAAIDMPEVQVLDTELKKMSEGQAIKVSKAEGEVVSIGSTAKLIQAKTSELIGLGKIVDSGDQEHVMVKPFLVFLEGRE